MVLLVTSMGALSTFVNVWMWIIKDSFPAFVFWPLLIAVLWGQAYLYRTAFRFEKHRIVFDENQIFVPDDWAGKDDKIQFETMIAYDEIQDVQLIRSEKNSRGGSITSPMPSSSYMKPYLEFTCKNGKKKRIFILYFTKKQREKIIDEIKLRMQHAGNGVALPPTSEMIANLPKW